jgi:predicted regulator of Ras-like GTPase activity (Roadblock/LC7/MglB family)
LIPVPLASVTMGWPEPVRQALAGLNAPDAVVNLPLAETEAALKRGKIQFPWKRLKSLIRPPLKTALPPALDDVTLELPLSAVAPVFMARRKARTTQKKLDFGADIPDIFSAKGLAAPTPAAPPAKPAPRPATPVATPVAAPVAKAPAPAPVAPALTTAAPVVAPSPGPAPVAPPAPVLATAAVSAQVPQDIGEVFGQAGRKNWAPAEIAQRTCTLPGVAGAIVAMQDGLLVAAHLPPGLNGEAIAAFLPPMYSRMLQYSKELKFGDSNRLTLVVEDVPLQIHRVGGLYFAVLGKSREPLPDALLRIVVAHFAPQSK